MPVDSTFWPHVDSVVRTVPYVVIQHSDPTSKADWVEAFATLAAVLVALIVPAVGAWFNNRDQRARTHAADARLSASALGLYRAVESFRNDLPDTANFHWPPDAPVRLREQFRGLEPRIYDMSANAAAASARSASVVDDVLVIYIMASRALDNAVDAFEQAEPNACENAFKQVRANAGAIMAALPIIAERHWPIYRLFSDAKPTQPLMPS